MIYHIKVYGPDGILKKEISSDEALRLYDKQAENIITLSEDERARLFEGMLFKDEVEEKESNYKHGMQPLSKRERKAIFGITCQHCGEQAMMKRANTKFCSVDCRHENAKKVKAITRVKVEIKATKKLAKQLLPEGGNLIKHLAPQENNKLVCHILSPELEEMVRGWKNAAIKYKKNQEENATGGQRDLSPGE